MLSSAQLNVASLAKAANKIAALASADLIVQVHQRAAEINKRL